MDNFLLIFFNQTIAHPLLDIVMITVTTVGFALLPALGVVLTLNSRQRKSGIAIFIALGFGFILTLTFQYLALRPRPQDVRLILPSPHFPSYPSGHAVAAFSVALIIGLTYKRWFIALIGASLIALSRVYLGHHFPSDILAGAVLGAAIGAVCYGLFIKPKVAWRWLLWPQIALALIVTHMAYLGLLSLYLLQWPFVDKILHFLLFGAIVFWLNLWVMGQKVRMGNWTIPLAILLPLVIATLEETAQLFSPLRTASLGDLFSDLMGMLFFWWLSSRLIVMQLQKQVEH